LYYIYKACIKNEIYYKLLVGLFNRFVNESILMSLISKSINKVIVTNEVVMELNVKKKG
jgi:hypothetical protein